MPTTHPTSPPLHARQRGTAYVLVIGITSLLVVLGLAAAQITKRQTERNQLHISEAQARLNAEYVQGYIQKLYDGSMNWRDNVGDNQWAYFFTYEGVSMYYAFEDPIDGQMAGDYTQPFRLYTLAVAGEAQRLYSAEYMPDEDGRLTRTSWTLQRETRAD